MSYELIGSIDSLDPERHALVEVAPDLIVKALHFPEGTEIVWATTIQGAFGPTVVLKVGHPDLPEVPYGEEAPTVIPKVTYHRESWDFDWGVEPTGSS